MEERTMSKQGYPEADLGADNVATLYPKALTLKNMGGDEITLDRGEVTKLLNFMRQHPDRFPQLCSEPTTPEPSDLAARVAWLEAWVGFQVSK